MTTTNSTPGMKEAVLRNAVINGAKTSYDKERRRLVLTVQVQAAVPPAEIAKFLEVQKDGAPVYVSIKSYQAGMDLDGD